MFILVTPLLVFFKECFIGCHSCPTRCSVGIKYLLISVCFIFLLLKTRCCSKTYNFVPISFKFWVLSILYSLNLVSMLYVNKCCHKKRNINYFEWFWVNRYELFFRIPALREKHIDEVSGLDMKFNDLAIKRFQFICGPFGPIMRILGWNRRHRNTQFSL